MALSSHSSLDGAPLLQNTIDEENHGANNINNTWLQRQLQVLIRKVLSRPPISTLKPSFIYRSPKSGKVHSTAWLDGIRGYASFFVFIYHFQHLFHRTYMLGYGSNAGNNDHWLVQLPIIRLVFNGGSMVSIFWVLSGVALSLKPLQSARSENWEKLFDTLSSSVFRRALRLYVPVCFVQCCVIVAACFGMYNHAYALSKNWPFGGTNETQFEVFATNAEQIRDWLRTMWKFANPFKPIRPAYDVHLWTIPYEFRNSIVLFATLCAFSKLKTRIRIALTAALYAFCVLIEEGDVALFIAGMGLAEFLLIREENTKHLPLAEKSSERQGVCAKIFWTGIFCIGLHLLSWPTQRYETSPGYITMHNTFKHIFHSTELSFQRIGAAIFLLALCGSEWLRQPFQTPFAMYLGKISFPLYLIHGPVTHMLGPSLVEIVWKITGSATLFTYELGVVISFGCCMVLVIWLADILMRVVDTPSVAFGRKLHSKFSC